MTPKEEAIIIYNRCYEVSKAINNFKEHFGVDYSSPLFKDFIKEYALITVNEAIEAVMDNYSSYDYYIKVKHEIEKL
jgi:hypothetical protein